MRATRACCRAEADGVEIGVEPGIWTAEAAERGYAVRIGLEDVLVLPDVSPIADNESLVTAAAGIVGRRGGEGGSGTADGR